MHLKRNSVILWIVPCSKKYCPGSVIGAGKFLVLKDLSFQDDRGRLRHWEAVDRDGEASAVFIIARIVPDDEILFVRQFRPPTGG